MVTSAVGQALARDDVRPESRPPTMLLAAISVGAVRGSVGTATQRAISATALPVARPSVVLAGVAPPLTENSAVAGTGRHGLPVPPVETA